MAPAGRTSDAVQKSQVQFPCSYAAGAEKGQAFGSKDPSGTHFPSVVFNISMKNWLMRTVAFMLETDTDVDIRTIGHLKHLRRDSGPVSGVGRDRCDQAQIEFETFKKSARAQVLSVLPRISVSRTTGILMRLSFCLQGVGEDPTDVNPGGFGASQVHGMKRYTAFDVPD